jgi:hypothetical protein
VTGYVSYQLVLKNLPGDAEARLELATSIDKGVVDEPVLVEEDEAGPGVG